MSATTARLERHGLKADEVISRLDGFYCYNVSVSLWADAVANRLEGLALYLLSEELAEAAQGRTCRGGQARCPYRRPRRLGDRPSRGADGPLARRLQGPSGLRRSCGDSRHRSVEPGRHHR